MPKPSFDKAAEKEARAPIRADIAHAEADRRRRRVAVDVIALAGALAAVLFIGLWIWRFALRDLPQIPDARGLWSLNRPPGATFLDRNGQVIGRRGPYHGRPLSLADLPPKVADAFLAAEDRRFFSHGGVDLEGIMRAARDDLLGRKGPLEGGSTITQQVARTLFLGPEQTFRRKLQEAILALEIERRLSKREILELYLNRIYFGAGAFGLEAASETYFGAPAARLSLAEAALLAALPKAPSRLSADGGFAAAKARSRLVLAAMRKEGWISAAEAAAALADPTRLVRQSRSEGDFGYVLDLAADEARIANTQGAPDLVIGLTIDARLQSAAAGAIAAAAKAGARAGASEGALVALGPDGGVLALVGGLDHRLSAFDRATQALRQPGSAFKPFVYAAALEAGLSPDDVRPDAPIQIGDWRPANADGAYAGEVTLRTALARSINTVAVRVSQEVGAKKVAALARRFGLASIPADPAPPIALGAYETTLLDLTSAYQVFQANGRRQPPYLIASIRNARGDLIYARPSAPAETVFAPARAAVMISMLEGVVTEGTGRRAQIGRPAAGKTGTSQDYRDAWFVGFTPDLLAGVWIGDDHDRPMDRVMGGDLPASAWRRFMSEALAGRPPLDFPPPPPPDPAAGPSLAGEERRLFYLALSGELAAAAAGGAADGTGGTKTPPPPEAASEAPPVEPPTASQGAPPPRAGSGPPEA